MRLVAKHQRKTICDHESHCNQHDCFRVCLRWRAVWHASALSALQNHLSAETKNIVNLGTGIIGTMAALVLGRLVASAKGSYDTQSNELTDVSSRILLPNCGVSGNGLPQLMVAIQILGTRRCKLVFRGLKQTIKAMRGAPHPGIAWLTSSHSPSQRAFNTGKMHFFPILG